MRKLIQTTKNKTYKFLRWTEKWTKTDMVYLFEGGFWLTLGQGVSSLSALLLAIAFANLVPKETYGHYKYILSIVSLLSIPTLSGMNTSITQAVARGYEGSFIPALKTKIRWGLLGGLASLLLAGYYYFNGNSELTIAFLISSVFLPFMDSFSLYGSLLIGKKEFKISTKYHVGSQLIIIPSLITILYFTQNIFLIIIGYFVLNTFSRLILLKLTLKKIQPNQKKDLQTIPYGKHLSLMGVLGTLSMQIDKILIFHYLGSAKLAIYIFAIAIPEQVKGFVKNIKSLAFPKFSQSQLLDEFKKSLLTKTWKSMGILSMITLGYILLSPWIFKIFFPLYIDSVIYSQIFSLTILLYPQILFMTYLEAQAKTKQLYFLNLFASITRILLLVILVPLYGIMGVISSILIVRSAGFAIVLYIFYRS